jgi:hypothetical protein
MTALGRLTSASPLDIIIQGHQDAMDAICTSMMMTTKAKRELGVRAFASG